MKSETKALTPEEKLTQALLPRDEWPYELPKGWVWTHWGSVGNFIAGNAFKKELQGNPDNDIPFYKVGSLKYTNEDGILFDTQNTVTQDEASKLKATLILPHALIFAKIGEAIRLNRRAVNNVLCCIDNNLMAFSCKNGETYRFVYFWSQTLDLYKLANATTVPAIRKTDLVKIPFPLPPLPEQQRIVDKIESLFSKLDEARDRLQKVLDGCEARRAAILHEAFSGKWMGNSGEQSDIKRIPLKKCGVWHFGVTPSKSHPEYWANGSIMWITSKDMKMDVIENSLVCVNEKGIENSSAVYSDKPAVLFVMRSGVLRHTLPIAMVSKPYTVNQDLKALTPEEGIIPEYVMWSCKAEEKTILNQCMKSGTTVESINFQSLLDFQIPVYPEKEQRYIVDRIHKALTLEESSFNHISSVYTRIDLMKKSILARAFRGKLGTQDPSDPPALDLLRECVMASEEDSKS